MKITYFNYLYDLYGVSIGSTIKAERLLEAMKNLGYDIHIHWRKGNEPVGKAQPTYRQTLKKYLANYLHEPKQILQNIHYLKEEHKFLKEEQPDLLISRLETYVFSPWLLRKQHRLPFIVEADSPVVYELKNFDLPYKTLDPLLEWLELETLRQADQVFTVSTTLKRHFVDRGIPSDLIQVIPNGADISRFHPDVSSLHIHRQYQLKGRVVIGFVGSFHYWHGVDQLMALIDIIAPKHPEAIFLMVGKGGPMREAFQNHVIANGLSEQVLFLDSIPHEEVPAVINAMDIALAPYPPLPFFYYSPVKMYEYMACGIPLVTSDLGQMAEIIEDGVTGMLCTPGDVNGFVNAISKLLKDKILRKTIGANAFQEIKNHHTWSHRARQLAKLCEISIRNVEA